MRIAYLDCFSGISGDMFLGALVDAGVSSKLFEDTVAALDIGARLEISRVQRGGISGTKVDVYANGEKDLPREASWKQQEHDHAHEHAHDHHEHDHDEAVWPRGSAPPQTGQSPVTTQHQDQEYHRHERPRGLNEIRQIIEKAAIHSNAKATRFAFSKRWARPKLRFTTCPSSKFTFTKSAPSMPWLTLSAPPWERTLWQSKNGYARR